MKKFESDSLNGLVFKLSCEISDLIKTDKQTKDIQDIFNEISKRIETSDNDLAEVMNEIDNIRAML